MASISVKSPEDDIEAISKIDSSNEMKVDFYPSNSLRGKVSNLILTHQFRVLLLTTEDDESRNLRY